MQMPPHPRQISDNNVMSEAIKTKTTTDVAVVILAAGQGKRMRSGLPKVLQTIAGKPMLTHVSMPLANFARTKFVSFTAMEVSRYGQALPKTISPGPSKSCN